MCSAYLMYINVNYLVFPFVYLKDIMEYEYTNHMRSKCSMYMCSIYPMYINVKHKCVCV